MHERPTLRRLGVIISAGIVTVGLAAFPAYTLADNGNGNFQLARQFGAICSRLKRRL